MKERALKYVDENPLGDRTIEMNKEHYIKKIERGDYFHFCKECGAIEFAGYVNEKDLIDKQQCFNCNLWIKRSGEIKDNTLIVMRNGKMDFLSDGGAQPPGTGGLGFGGAKWKYYKLGETENIIETNNMWHGGDIPEHLHSLFTINAVIEV